MRIILLTCWILITINSKSQIWSNDITATNPNTSNPFTSGQMVNSNITVSGIGRGSGITGVNTNNRYNAVNWAGTSLDLDQYFSFTLTPNNNNPNYQIYFSNFTYTGQASPTGPTSFTFRSSLDNFNSDIGTANELGTTIDLSNIMFQRITTSITFRFYGWNASDNSGSYSINDFSFSGFVKLPIQLASFDLSHLNGKPTITWSSLSEQNNHYYSLERSTDAKDFIQIKKCYGFGQGTTDKKMEYNYIDQHPFPGLNYYRLRQVDLDGTETVYPAKSIFLAPEKTIVFPTMFQSSISILFTDPPSQNGKWQLLNTNGQLISKGLLSDQNIRQEIFFGDLAPGVYSFLVNGKTGKEVFKLIKY